MSVLYWRVDVYLQCPFMILFSILSLFSWIGFWFCFRLLLFLTLSGIGSWYLLLITSITSRNRFFILSFHSSFTFLISYICLLSIISPAIFCSYVSQVVCVYLSFSSRFVYVTFDLLIHVVFSHRDFSHPFICQFYHLLILPSIDSVIYRVYHLLILSSTYSIIYQSYHL